MMNKMVDVLVLGGGNAGFTAALAAAERGRSVALLEKAGQDRAGGNSYYTAGATRIPHGGLDDISDFIESDERHAATEVPPYSANDYLADLEKVSGGRNDPALSRV
ncbi:MAG TPA: tricarballylate dehydrogenase, partial [Arthrobacter bacterium]|nr:tricarballylate dehydrogenase [Arthrobacter sp.]